MTIARRNYHVFIERILRQLPLVSAKAAGVDVALLSAVRVRHKLPRDPRGPRAAAVRKPVRHDSRRRRRPLIVVRKPKPVESPVARQPRPEPLQPNQFPLPGIATPSSDPIRPKMTGTMEKPEGYADWKIVNEVARQKVGKQNRQVFFIKGTTFNNRTKESYDADDLVRLFQLTPVEAQSLLMTFTK